MCPECFASIAILVSGAISTGGVAAASIKIFRHKKIAAKLSKPVHPILTKEKGK